MSNIKIKPKFYYENKVPVFEPSYEQFANFNEFIHSIMPYGQEVGLAKVIPPKNWPGLDLDLEKKLKKFAINHPIKQSFAGLSGIFRQTNIESHRKFTTERFWELSQDNKYRPPRLSSELSNSDKIPSRPDFSISTRNEATIGKNTLASSSPLSSSPILEVKKEFTIENPLLKKASISYFTPEVLKYYEQKYWSSISYNPPYYGADLPGTLFEENVNSWNLNYLGDLLHQIDVQLPGVNSPYLYFGMWRATFSWHVEDMDLFSINYIHHGAPKQWYVIPPASKFQFENIMQNLFSSSYSTCSEFLRHKTSMVSPKVIKESGIPVYRLVQFEGEFVITFPNGYHAGYNLDFNVAESVNFANEFWVPIGCQAKICKCHKDSVKIDMSLFKRIVPQAHISANQKKKTSAKKFKAKNTLEASSSKESKYNFSFNSQHLIPQKEICSKESVKCLLCFRENNDEILRSFFDTGYAHRLCSKFTPRVRIIFHKGFKKDTVFGLERVLIEDEDKSNLCYICNEQIGVTVSCGHLPCKNSFHISCVPRFNLVTQPKLTTYCVSHGPNYSITESTSELINIIGSEDSSME